MDFNQHLLQFLLWELECFKKSVFSICKLTESDRKGFLLSMCSSVQ